MHGKELKSSIIDGANWRWRHHSRALIATAWRRSSQVSKDWKFGPNSHKSISKDPTASFATPIQTVCRRSGTSMLLIPPPKISKWNVATATLDASEGFILDCVFQTQKFAFLGQDSRDLSQAIHPYTGKFKVRMNMFWIYSFQDSKPRNLIGRPHAGLQRC